MEMKSDWTTTDVMGDEKDEVSVALPFPTQKKQGGEQEDDVNKKKSDNRSCR